MTFVLLRSWLPARFWTLCCGWQAELHTLSLPFPLCAQRGRFCQDEDHHSTQAAAGVLGFPLSCAHPRRGALWSDEPPNCHMWGRHAVCVYSICSSLALQLGYVVFSDKRSCLGVLSYASLGAEQRMPARVLSTLLCRSWAALLAAPEEDRSRKLQN